MAIRVTADMRRWARTALRATTRATPVINLIMDMATATAVTAPVMARTAMTVAMVCMAAAVLPIATAASATATADMASVVMGWAAAPSAAWDLVAWAVSACINRESPPRIGRAQTGSTC